MTAYCFGALYLALSYYSDLTLSQEFQPMAAQLSKKAALPLAKILATCRNNVSNTWTLRDWSRAWPTLTWLAKLVGVSVSSSVRNTNFPHTLKPWARFQKRSDHCEKVIGSLISRPLTISRSDRIPRTILLWSDHDPGRSCSRLGSVLDQKFHHNNWSFYQ